MKKHEASGYFLESSQGKMPNPLAILGRLEALIAGGMNIGMIEKRTGIDESLLNAVLDHKDRDGLGGHKGVYGFESNARSENELLTNVAQWLEIYDEEIREKARHYTEIPTGFYIEGIAMEAMESKRLFHLIGAFGISKTKTLERFAQLHPMTHETPGAAYLSLTDEDKKFTQVYQRVSDAMRINEKFVTRGRSIGQRVRNTLRPGDLLIVDEANYAFKHDTWPTLRDIFDGSDASMLIVSNPTANGFVKKHQGDLGAFLSRARTRMIDGNERNDGTEYAAAIGYTCPKIIDEAGKMVCRPGPSGGMRFLAKAFEDAETKARAENKVVDVALLREAAKMNSVFFR